MAKKSKKSLVDEAEEKMRKGGERGRRLANLPEDIGLWLYYRKVTGKRVAAIMVEKVTDGEITAAMVNNFFSKWYGIGRNEPFKSFKEIYEYLNSKIEDAKLPADHPKRGIRYNIVAPSKAEMEKMIEECERKYGIKVDSD